MEILTYTCGTRLEDYCERLNQVLPIAEAYRKNIANV